MVNLKLTCIRSDVVVDSSPLALMSCFLIYFYILDLEFWLSFETVSVTSSVLKDRNKFRNLFFVVEEVPESKLLTVGDKKLVIVIIELQSSIGISLELK